MNIVGLQTFVSIVENGSLVRASEQLNVTQSTVTARLRTLEQEIGAILLHRQKSGVTLTASGTKLLGYAEIMIGLWRQARQETAPPQGTESVCNFGCDPDLWPGLGRQIFNEVNDRNPRMALSLWPGDQSELYRKLSAGLLDVALTYRLAAPGDQAVYRLPPDDLVLYATEPDRPIRFDPSYIYVDLGPEFRAKHALAFSDFGTARVNFGSAIWALNHMLDHGGSAYLPRRMATPHVLASRLFALPNAPSFQRNIFLIVNPVAAAQWTWMPGLVEKFGVSQA
jgi:LysR family transcriptional regulator, flagellar master operon regulator